jgi:iron transport multicopper oxidase
VGIALVRQISHPRISKVEPWTFSHIDWHLNQGLAIVLAEDVPAIAKTDPPGKFNYSLLMNFILIRTRFLEAWDALCPAYNAFLSEMPTLS